jgi:hypothetical protein
MSTELNAFWVVSIMPSFNPRAVMTDLTPMSTMNKMTGVRVSSIIFASVFAGERR